MGGFGSGRQGWRRKCEHLLRLDVRVLSRRGSVPSEPHICNFSRGTGLAVMSRRGTSPSRPTTILLQLN